MIDQTELNACIEENEKLLIFYVRYREDIIAMSSRLEWEIEVDECLDELINLYRLLKE